MSCDTVAPRPETDDPPSNRDGVFIDVQSGNSSERIDRREPPSNKGIESRKQERTATTSGVDHESRKIRGRRDRIIVGSTEGQRRDGVGRIPRRVPRSAGGAS